MNIYEKLQRVRTQMVGIKKSGQNSFAKYEYYELEDFLPLAMRLFAEIGLCSVVSYGQDRSAKLTLVNTEKTDEQIIVESSSATCDLKGCHDVQNMGAVQTYQRRYLYVTLLEITEKELVDSQEPKQPKPATPAKPLFPNPKPATEEETIMLCKFGTVEAINNALLDYTKKGIVFNPEQKARITDRRAELELMKK
jgi:hypothetical protein